MADGVQSQKMLAPTLGLDERTLDLIEQVNDVLDFEDAMRKPSPHTPRRMYKAALAIQVTRSIAIKHGARIQPDEPHMVEDSFWWLCPPSQR